MKTYEMTEEQAEFDKYLKYFDAKEVLNECRVKAEQAMRELGEPEFEMYKPKIIDAYFPYTTRTEEQRANHYIALFAVAQNEQNFLSVPMALKTPEFMKTAFRFNPRVIKYMPREFTRDAEIIRMIAKYRPELLKYLGFNANEKLAMLAVSINPSAYLELNSNLQKNEDIIFVAINRNEQSNINQKHYDDNLAYVRETLKIEASKQVVREVKEEVKKRYRGPVLRAERKGKDKK